jgi:hypothetical protein
MEDEIRKTDKYGNLYANDTICRRFLKLGFPFAECQWQKQHDSRELFYELPIDDPEWANCKAYYRPLLTTINDWLAFGNLKERQSRDEALENKFNSMIKEGIL